MCKVVGVLGVQRRGCTAGQACSRLGVQQAGGALWWLCIVVLRIVVAVRCGGCAAWRMCSVAGEQQRAPARRQRGPGSEAGASSPWKLLAVAALVLKRESMEAARARRRGWCCVGGTGSEAGRALGSPAGRDEGREEAELSCIS